MFWLFKWILIIAVAIYVILLVYRLWRGGLHYKVDNVLLTMRYILFVYLLSSSVILITRNCAINSNLNDYEEVRAVAEYNTNHNIPFSYELMKDIIEVNKTIIVNQEYYDHPYLGVFCSDSVAKLPLINY